MLENYENSGKSYQQMNKNKNKETFPKSIGIRKYNLLPFNLNSFWKEKINKYLSFLHH